MSIYILRSGCFSELRFPILMFRFDSSPESYSVGYFTFLWCCTFHDYFRSHLTPSTCQVLLSLTPFLTLLFSFFAVEICEK